MCPHRINPTELSSRTLATTPLFEIVESRVRFANGIERHLERITNRIGPTVLIVPVHDDRLILIWEYCFGSQRYELGFPTGAIKLGETIEVAADRELREEIGFGSGHIVRLSTLNVLPGHFNHQTYVVVAEKLYPDKLAGDEPEPLECVHFLLAEVLCLLQRGELSEARSVAALLLFERMIGVDRQLFTEDLS
jgi:ADP-ribose diphosphatase